MYSMNYVGFTRHKLQYRFINSKEVETKTIVLKYTLSLKLEYGIQNQIIIVNKLGFKRFPFHFIFIHWHPVDI